MNFYREKMSFVSPAIYNIFSMCGPNFLPNYFNTVI